MRSVRIVMMATRPDDRSRQPLRKRLLRLAATLFASLTIAGCGFHLQGASPLPPGIDAMYVVYNDHYRVGDPPLVETLRQRLRQRSLLGRAGAPARLDIQDIENRQRIVSVSPIDGGVAEYELTAQVMFDYSVNGAGQLDDETLSVTRDYSFDDTQRLAAEAEQRDLLTRMHEELADLILLRIAAVNDRLARAS